MKLNRTILTLIVLLSILTLSAVSADENATITDDMAEAEIVQTQEIEKISDYSYDIEIPEGNVTSYYMKIEEMPKDASGNITMSIDGIEKYNKYVSPVVNRLVLENLTFGNHTAQIKYTGDDKYAGFVKDTSFNYLPVIIEVPEEVEIGSYDRIKIFIAEEVTANVKIAIDGKSVFNRAISIDDLYDWDFIDGMYYPYYFEKLSLGKHTYTITYSWGNQKSMKKSGTFKTSYLFDVENKNNITYGENVTFNVELIDSANSKLKVTLNDKTYTAKLSDGYVDITLSDFNLGENIVTFSYEDKTLPKKTVTRIINVKPNLTSPDVIDYNDNANIVLEVPKNLNGNLTALINDKRFQSEITDGKAVISLADLEPGKYEVALSSDYVNVNYTMTVKPNLKMPAKIFNGETYNLTFSAPQSYSGILELRGMINTDVSIINGSAVIPISDMKARLYQLNAAYIENGTSLYTWKFNTEFSNINPDCIEIDLPYEINVNREYCYSEIVKNVQEDAKGEITFYIDGETFKKMDISELPYEDVFYFDGYEIKNHTLTIYYVGDEYYKPINRTVAFELKQVLIQMNPTNESVIIIFPADDKGSVTVNVDGAKLKTKKIKPDDYDNYQIYEIALKDYKTQSVEVIYSGKYGEITKQMTVTPSYLFEMIPDEYYHYGEDNFISIYAPSKLTNEITVYVDGVKYDSFSPKLIDDEDEGYWANLTNLTPGKHEITATYPGDSEHSSKTINTTISIMGVIECPYWIYYEDNVNFTLTLPQDAQGRLNLYILDENGNYNLYNSSEIRNGFAEIQAPSSKIGEYNYTLSFEGNYPVEEVEDNMQVRMSLNYPYEMTWGDDEFITLHVPYTEDGYLSIISFSGDEFYEVKFNGSDVKISLSDLDIGDYSEGYLIGQYYDNGKIVDFDSMSIIVNPIPAKLDGGKDINMYYWDGSTYSLQIWGDYGEIVGAGEEVTFYIGKNEYTAKTDANGTATLKITDLPGKYTIEVEYHGISVKNTLKVKQVLKLKKVKVKRSAKKLVLTATLKKGKTPIKKQKITFKFNGKKYKAKTNKKGIAKVTIKKTVLKKLKAGKKLTYTATYKKNTVKQKVKIQK
ncbi:Ig-like domain-containing protein [Methanobrevibacter sp.]|uniref:Ig-like domain-containing protein n=1 Tax=Methanobrevibacter sp. TaxID=66852 RepID=UPI0038906961